MMTWYSPCGYSRTDLFTGGTGIAECPQCHSFQWSSVPPGPPLTVAASAGAIPGLPVNWPSPSTNTPNVDRHPLEHYWSDRAEWLEDLRAAAEAVLPENMEGATVEVGQERWARLRDLVHPPRPSRRPTATHVRPQ